MKWLLRKLGERLAKYLSTPLPQDARGATSPPEKLAGALEPGDVLLIEGHTRVSGAIKYLTQSTWSHAALYVGDALGAIDGQTRTGEEPKVLIEADLRAGVRAVPLGHVAGLHTRICRPVGLTAEDLRKVIGFAVQSIGESYDLKNLFDLARYLLPTPPVPARFRRRMIALGSGDPTRAICSTMIAQAFGLVRYPILPIWTPPRPGAGEAQAQEELLHIRHHSLYVPRDFDISPYFAIVKPNLAHGFDYRKLRWAETEGETRPSPLGPS
jgi:hypothetical protein